MQSTQQVKRISPLISRWVLIILLVLSSLVLVFLFSRIPSIGRMGKNDFIGYWSATYLFRRNVNPYDLQSMDRFQHLGMQTGENATIMAWNPPTLFVFLLPLSWLSFDSARSALLLVNLLIVSTAALMLAHLYLPGAGGRFALVCMIFSFLFPPVLVGMYMGQVTFLVFIGLVGCVFLLNRGAWFWAGAVLILTTIKPHLVLLSVIYLLSYVVKHRHFRALWGLALAGIFCMLILTVFRGPWISDLLSLMAVAPVNWATPTLGGLLSYFHITEAARSMLILFLPLPFVLLKYDNVIRMEMAVALLTLITLPVTFFGWSYDQTMLLIPIAQLFAWIALSGQKMKNAWIFIAISLTLVMNYVLRFLAMNEVYYVWIALSWWVVFALGWVILRPARFLDASLAGRVGPHP